MASNEQNILVVLPIADGKTRYLTAKKLSRIFREVSFSEWKAKLDAGGNTVVSRSEDQNDFTDLRRSLEMLGAETEVIEQKTIGGAKVF